MKLLILPISGACFLNQVCGMSILCDSEYVPDLTMATSGGNVCAYVTAAADFRWSKLEHIISTLSNDLFIKPWSMFKPLSFVMGYFLGNVYNQGNGVKDLFHRFFVKNEYASPQNLLIKHEIITGTYNNTLKKAHFFSNKKQSESHLKNYNATKCSLYQILPLSFLNGDIDKITQASIASASIPGVVSPQKIDDHDYIDGGVYTSSPLITFKMDILKNIKNNPKECLQIIYCNSININLITDVKLNNALDTVKQATQEIMRSQIIIDRSTAYEMICYFAKDIKYKEFECTTENLINVYKYNYFLLEIYPEIPNVIDLTNFSKNELVDGIANTKNLMKCRFWYGK